MIEDLAIPEPNSGCYIWLGATNSKGYSTVMRPRIKGSQKRWTTGHKRSYEEWNGEVPEGMQIRHKCGNRLCVNHEHLTHGTQSENEKDKLRHGTAVYYFQYAPRLGSRVLAGGKI